MSNESVRGFAKRWAKQNPDEDNVFKQDFLCCICRDVFYMCVSLACTHYFCRRCISTELDACRIRNNKMKCPVCKKTVGNVAHIRNEPKITELQEVHGCVRLPTEEEKQPFVFHTKEQVQQVYEQNMADEFPEEYEDEEEQNDDEDSDHEEEGDEEDDEEENGDLEEEEEQEEEEIVPVRRILTRSSAAIVVEQPLPKRRRIQPQVIEVD